MARLFRSMARTGAIIGSANVTKHKCNLKYAVQNQTKQPTKTLIIPVVLARASIENMFAMLGIIGDEIIQTEDIYYAKRELILGMWLINV